MWLSKLFGTEKQSASDVVRTLLSDSGLLRDGSMPMPLPGLDYGTGRPPAVLYWAEPAFSKEKGSAFSPLMYQESSKTGRIVLAWPSGIEYGGTAAFLTGVPRFREAVTEFARKRNLELYSGSECKGVSVLTDNRRSVERLLTDCDLLPTLMQVRLWYGWTDFWLVAGCCYFSIAPLFGSSAENRLSSMDDLEEMAAAGEIIQMSLESPKRDPWPPRTPLRFNTRAIMVDGTCYEKGEDNISPPERYYIKLRYMLNGRGSFQCQVWPDRNIWADISVGDPLPLYIHQNSPNDPLCPVGRGWWHEVS